MSDDAAFVFCHRVADLDDPIPTAVPMQCEWRADGRRCTELVWVAPSSIEIALTEHALIVCNEHVHDVVQMSEEVMLVAHPSQGREMQVAILEAGGITNDEAHIVRERERQR